jgi:hypothetical protein
MKGKARLRSVRRRPGLTKVQICQTVIGSERTIPPAAATLKGIERPSIGLVTTTCWPNGEWVWLRARCRGRSRIQSIWWLKTKATPVATAQATMLIRTTRRSSSRCSMNVNWRSSATGGFS